MKILGIDIDWQTRYSTDTAYLEVTVDTLPDWRNDFKFQKIQREKRMMSGKEIYSYYYWAEANGILQAHHHKPWYQDGYGGSVFTLLMMDGTTETIKGPWDEGCSTANKLLQNHYFGIGLNSPTNTFHCATMMRVDMLNEFLQKFDDRLQLKPKEYQTTGLGDQQSHVILYGEKIIPDTVIYILDKKLIGSFCHSTDHGDEHTKIGEVVSWKNKLRATYQ